MGAGGMLDRDNDTLYSGFMPGIGELLVILFIVLLLFGGAKIPQIARSLGEGIREFKRAVKEDPEEKKEDKKN